MDAREEELLICFRNITSYLSNTLDSYAKSYGLTGVQCMIITEVGNADQITIGELGNNLNLSKANLSAILKRMQLKGLIEKQRSLEDQRVVYLALTEYSQTIYDDIVKNVSSHFPAWQKLGEEKQNSILEALKMIEDLIIKGENVE